MIRIYADYHTHTTYSDGKGSIEDNVRAAIARGLKILAISDHGPQHLTYGIKRKKYAEMRGIIDEMNAKYPMIRTLLGVEANIMDPDGRLDVDEGMLRMADVLLAGYHFGSLSGDLKGTSTLHRLNFEGRFSRKAAEKAKEMNTKAVINAMRNYDIKILTHPGAKGAIDVLAAAEAAIETKTALEVNANRHGHLTFEDLFLLRNSECRFAINSDAHRPEMIGRFEPAIERVLRAKIPCGRIINCLQSDGSTGEDADTNTNVNTNAKEGAEEDVVMAHFEKAGEV
ncbi:PHP domain-containing protein [Acidaminobacter hydrogenoformans]|uniref:PHP domain-containing protein n=1 Tax=Acidaminobacter hydrogenoformans TaxID=65403 RepID=UPI00147BAEE1|nr:PHP domain-containing protein [Acidaminobacter hydrogenoformans]